MMNFFFCNVIWNGQRRMVSLRYDLNKHRWYLYKSMNYFLGKDKKAPCLIMGKRLQ